MREFIGLFRGKRIDNGEWVEGAYLFTGRYHVIVTGRIEEQHVVYGHYSVCVPMYVVDPDTVGECTGLRDKNGKLIFERHVLMYGGNIGYVNYGTGCFCVKSCTPDWRNRNNPAIDIIFNEYPNDVVIIGELEDFPELLKGGEGDGNI